MSTKWTLGSFIPNPVTADIVSFLEQDDKLTFSLSSPTANALAHRYRVLNNIDASHIRFSSDDDNNLTVYMDYDRVVNTSEKCGSQKAEAFIVRLLGMCGSISNLVWGRNESFKCIINAKIYNKLRTLPLGSIDIYGNVDLTADQLLQLRSKVNILRLLKCQVNSDLVTDEILQKLCEKYFRLKVEPALSNTENCTIVQTTVSDRFLNYLINSSDHMNVSFGNFHTKFTTEGIRRVVMTFPYSNFNFGILDASQIESAHAFLMERINEMYTLDSQLLIINGQYFIRYQSSGERYNGTVSLGLPTPSNFEWKQTNLSPQNLVEFFLQYPQIVDKHFYTGKRFEEYELPAEYLTNEFVCALLLCKVAIDVTWTGENNEAVTTLSDQLLVMLAERNSHFDIRLSIKGYRSGFTIQGIETLTPKTTISCTLNDSEEVKAVRFLSSIQLNPDSIWRIVTVSWDNGLLQSFKVASNVRSGIYIDVDFEGRKKTVDHGLKVVQIIDESNFHKLLASGNIWIKQDFLNNKFKPLDLLHMMIIGYEYHLDYVKAKVKEYLNVMDSDFLFDDRFFSLPCDQQAFVLNMVYSQHNRGMYSYPERFDDILFTFADYFD